ncbi:hypothetical protein [Limnobacter sp.]|uniref:hypothetical protein n=1 Tax=Limnobacter sp. TaxID=2003368 RepID=UPI00258C60F0|nr:hypothetical protein [Limnobacter sp.]
MSNIRKKSFDQGREPVGNGHVVVAPLSLRGFAAPERRRRTGLVGARSSRGVTSAGDNAVLEGLRDGAAARPFDGA